ncbi:MAG: 1-deoxy-D-xylulose-5-phosphate synthase [Verrucomicrobiales bacterium]|jgi:1-deoxy-D-xylulose-5-phosphate synthase|nr:1-deoxy-D-xylulose-5-phosphate synthase [Verrucomicrobiales bacterium]
MARILDTINSPADLKRVPLEQLPVLAREIREELIAVASKNGGHLGPNLGVVELTIALHRAFDTPTDHFLFDVSHQAYVHKLLTGRRDRFATIRQPGGLNGFMNREESAHDCFGAGHAGTALSAALGMAKARDLCGGQEHVVALAGDAAFTCGVTYEALNNIATTTKRMIVILNDNEWSIDKNVGAIANYFNKLVTNENYSYLHERASRFIEKIGGRVAVKMLKRAEEVTKGFLLPSVIFEELGLTYYGPVNGHDIPTLIKTFEFLKTQEHPVLLHALTEKGRGYAPAMVQRKAFHGTPAFNPDTGEAAGATTTPTFSQLLGDHLCQIAATDPRVVAITAGMPNGTGLERFQPRFPDRYFDVGIAEEHAVLFAAGMAAKGFKPVVAIYSTFMQRAVDMIIHDVCLQNLPVVFCLDRGGISGDDGPTHHGLFDIAHFRGVPNAVHMSPKDEDEFVDMLHTALRQPGPVALRYPRGIGTGAKVKAQPLTLTVGQAEVIKPGGPVAVWFYGRMGELARQLADELARRGYDAAMVNARFAKPLDTAALEASARSAGLIFTLEDHALMGGFGSAVLEELSNLRLTVPVVRVGWPDRFIEHGKEAGLREAHGLTVSAALAKAAPYLQHLKPVAV